MAYNLRIESINDINKIAKTRPDRDKIQQIAEFIISEYGEFIVIDPKGNYKSIKIAREVSKKQTINQIKSMLQRKNIPTAGWNITFGNGSGAAAGGGNAQETKHQENATRIFCEWLIEKNKEPDMKILQKTYPKIDDSWYDSCNITAATLKRWLGNRRGYEYSRDEGIMPYIENLAKMFGGVSTKDNWNPMDIVIMKKSKKANIIEELEKIKSISEKDAALDALNEIMRHYGQQKDLVGISLKKVSPKRAIKTEWSDPKKTLSNKPSIAIRAINFNFDMIGQGAEFKTGELSFKLDINGYEVAMQSRAFSGGQRERNQFDMTGKGASAKLGKVSGPLAIDPFLHKHNMKRFEMKDMPQIGRWTDADIDYWVQMFSRLNNISIMRIRPDWGENNTVAKWKQVLHQAIEAEQQRAKTASQLSSKLQSLFMLENMLKLDIKKQLENFLINMYYGAKKQYSSAGVFLKISD